LCQTSWVKEGIDLIIIFNDDSNLTRNDIQCGSTTVFVRSKSRADLIGFLSLFGTFRGASVNILEVEVLEES